MAGADYRGCDRCARKTFYDANLNWGKEGLDGLGDWTVLCPECAKTHRTVFVPRVVVELTWNENTKSFEETRRGAPSDFPRLPESDPDQD